MMLQIGKNFLQLHEESFAWLVAIWIHVELC